MCSADGFSACFLIASTVPLPPFLRPRSVLLPQLLRPRRPTLQAALRPRVTAAGSFAGPSSVGGTTGSPVAISVIADIGAGSVELQERSRMAINTN